MIGILGQKASQEAFDNANMILRTKKHVHDSAAILPLRASEIVYRYYSILQKKCDKKQRNMI